MLTSLFKPKHLYQRSMILANSPWKEKQNWALVAAYITQVVNSLRRDHDTKKIMETLEQLDEKASKRSRKARRRHLLITMLFTWLTAIEITHPIVLGNFATKSSIK